MNEPHGGGQPLLHIEHLSKTFPGQRALDDVDITLMPGRTHALVGQNGSGKSTLIKVLAGYHQPDPGAVAQLNGEPFPLGDAEAAHDAGIRFVHQDLGLVDVFSAVENIAMGAGYDVHRFGRIDWRANRRRATEGLADIGFDDIPVDIPVAALPAAQRTAVALARALHGWETGAHLVVLDEPTATLPAADVERLAAAIDRLNQRGVAILYVSHHLDEVLTIAQDVTVLRDGRRVTTEPVAGLDHDRLVELMIGHRLERAARTAGTSAAGAPRLVVRGLAGGTVRGVDLTVHAGEIVGVAGITGSGRELLAPFITGQAPSDDGTVHVVGVDVANYTPEESLRAGMAFVPANRARLGIIPLQSVTANLTLADVSRNWRGGRLRHDLERAECVEWIERLDVKTAGTEIPIAALSGGNQQKVLFGRSLRLDPPVLVLDEPTNGIDVAAKEQIHQLIDRLARDGTAVLVVSTDTDELVQLAQRVVVMVDGRIADELIGDEITPEHVEHAQLQRKAS